MFASPPVPTHCSLVISPLIPHCLWPVDAKVLLEILFEYHPDQVARFPFFWEHDVEAWFVRVESELARTASHQLLCQLDQKVARELTAITVKPFYPGKRKEIKDEIIPIYSVNHYSE